MASFEFTSPDGKTYEVTGPEGATQEQAFQILRQQNPQLFGGGEPTQPPAPAAAPAPSFAQGAGQALKETGQNIYGLARGALAGTLGLPGEIESAVRRGTGPLGAGLRMLSPGAQVLPTTQTVRENLPLPPAEGRVAQTFEDIGEIVGMPGAGIVGRAAQRGGRGAARLAFGTPTATGRHLAERAEELGFKLEAGQVRQDSPVSTPGFLGARENNQRLANELASAPTGARVPEINAAFFQERYKDLGPRFAEVYLGPGGQAAPRQLTLDPQALTELRDLADRESRIRPGAAGSAKSAAETLLDGATGSPWGHQVSGYELHRIRTELSDVARTASDPMDRRIAREFIGAIDESVARNHPKLKAVLDVINPQYRALSTLEELARHNGIRGGNISLEQLGDMMQSADYGMATGRSRNPLAELGTLGRELGIRGRWEATKRGEGEGINAILDKLGVRGLAASLSGERLQVARAAQRRANQPHQPRREGPSVLQGARAGAAAARGVNGED